jgi:hypothetical protein
MNNFNTGANSQVWIIKSRAENLAYEHLLNGDHQYSYQIQQLQQCESGLGTLAAILEDELPSCVLLDWELCDRQTEKFL